MSDLFPHGIFVSDLFPHEFEYIQNDNLFQPDMSEANADLMVSGLSPLPHKNSGGTTV